MELFAAMGMRPCCLPLLEPQTFEVQEPPPVNAEDSTIRLAGACSVMLARWFSAMKACIGRERTRQQQFREDNALPRSARVPYERPPLTASEAALSELCEASIRAMFGDAPADYARDKFQDAIATGDMRSFKIRLLFIKIRDSLSGSPMKPRFAEVLDHFISNAEELAGCRPDPSPRRLSKAEQQAKLDKERILRIATEAQPELPLVWDSVKRDGAEAESRTSTDTESPSEKGLFKILKISADDGRCPQGEVQNSHSEDSVTVTHDNKSRKARHKSKEYTSVDQILSDIERGRLAPYESVDNICDDLKSGLITPTEAMLFTAAMSEYMGDDHEDEEDAELDEMSEDGADDPDEEGEEDGERGTGFSYNPDGFMGEVDEDI